LLRAFLAPPGRQRLLPPKPFRMVYRGSLSSANLRLCTDFKKLADAALRRVGMPRWPTTLQAWARIVL